MPSLIDTQENQIRKDYPEVLDILLRDHTTGHNILWATDNYRELGDQYQADKPILPEQITGKKGNVIKPRVQKHNKIFH